MTPTGLSPVVTSAGVGVLTEKGDAVSDTFFVTMKYEVPMEFISDLRLMQLEDGPDEDGVNDG